jgi:diacylglycerol kinase (ATP)
MNPEIQNALLIHNPNAGNGGHGRRTMLDEARRIFASCGIQTDLAETTKAGDATEIAQRAHVEGRHLAKELNLPWDIPSAAEMLVRGVVRDIPLGLATPLNEPAKTKYFLSVAGAGPDGMIVYSIDLDLKARVGILAYWWQGAYEAFRYKFKRFRVVAAGKEIEASLVVIGRTKHYGGPFKITTDADLYEDQFELMTLTTQSGLRYLSYLPTLFFGKLRGTEGVDFWKADRVVCEPLGEDPIYAQVDGEPLARLPVEFRIMPRALKLLVPGNGLPTGSKAAAKP